MCELCTKAVKINQKLKASNVICAAYGFMFGMGFRPLPNFPSCNYQTVFKSHLDICKSTAIRVYFVLAYCLFVQKVTVCSSTCTCYPLQINLNEGGLGNSLNLYIQTCVKKCYPKILLALI